MATVKYVVFKQMTASDFFYINQAGLEKGGGQAYIDFDTSDVSGADWANFFAGAPQDFGAQDRPFWTFTVHNLGAGTTQEGVTLGQRRSTSYNIRSQKLPEHSNKGRRLHAWSPAYTGFPEVPAEAQGAEDIPPGLITGLTIFLIRDEAGEFWAGWTRDVAHGVSDPRLKRMFSEKAGIIDLENGYEIDETKPNWPFLEIAVPGDAAEVALGDAPAENAVEVTTQAEEAWLEEDQVSDAAPGITYSLTAVRKRDRRALRKLRDLYATCQITGENFVFKTKSGKPYLEVHHLVPLGLGGADHPHNMVVISAHIHRMLHYADVGPVDLSKVKDNKLTITINGQEFTITWHPKHAELVLAHNPASPA